MDDVVARGFEAPIAELNARALAAHREGRLREALAIFDALAARAPTLAVLHSNRATILAELGEDAAALAAFKRALELDPKHVDARLGLGAVLRRRGAVAEALGCYRIAAALDPERLDAHLAIYELAQIAGDRATALSHQQAALLMRRLFTEPATGPAPRRRVLVLKVPGDWQANLPIEYLLDRERTTIDTYFVDDVELLAPTVELPPAEIVFNAIAESEEAEPALRIVPRFVERLGLPLINDPARIPAVARSHFPALLAGIPRCRAPQAVRLSRAALTPAGLAAAGLAPPFLLRPLASHGGNDLARIAALEELPPFLERVAGDSFYATPFVDYASSDGHYRKYRFVFVEGEPYPYHLAISPRWMVHYYNAEMRSHEWKRAEEARFLAEPEAVFDAGLQAALRRLAAAVGLDYFGLDCAVTREGELLVFEIETGMIVHNLDPVEIYPYKPAAFARIAGALEALIDRRIAAAREALSAAES